MDRVQTDAYSDLDTTAGELAARARAAVDRAEAIARQHPAAAEVLDRGHDRRTSAEIARLQRVEVAARLAGGEASAAWDAAVATWWTLAMTCRRLALQEVRRRPGMLAQLPREDLDQEAMLGAYDAARHYDAARGSFTTIVGHHVHARLTRAIERAGRAIRIPAGALQAALLARRLQDRGPRPRPLDELAADVGVRPATLLAAVAALHVASLDAPISAADDRPTSELVPAGGPGADEDLDERQAAARLDAEVMALPLRARFLVEARSRGRSLELVGEALGVSRQAAHVLEQNTTARILRRLRRPPARTAPEGPPARTAPAEPDLHAMLARVPLSRLQEASRRRRDPLSAALDLVALEVLEAAIARQAERGKRFQWR